MQINIKIAIIIPYFGKWPYWIDLFMYSCRQNEDVDFFFYTDCDIPDVISGARNVHFFSVSFDDYCQMVGEKLGITFHPDKPYKLCDLKPFYGFIHHDMLEEGKYDFWGYGDVDLVWGDIRKFCTNSILERNDVFSTHADRVSGHFALIRNTEKYRDLCFEIPQWKDKLEDKKNFALDEVDFSILLYGKIVKLWWKIHKLLMQNPHINEWTIYQRFLNIVNKFFLPRKLYFVEQNTTPFPDAISQKKVLYSYMEGKMINVLSGSEIMYLHFLFLKKIWKEKECFKNYEFDNVFFSMDGIICNNNDS